MLAIARQNAFGSCLVVGFVILGLMSIFWK
jgi:hypothetical protein